MPCVYRGAWYPSRYAAAQACGVTHAAVYNAMARLARAADVRHVRVTIPVAPWDQIEPVPMVEPVRTAVDKPVYKPVGKAPLAWGDEINAIAIHYLGAALLQVSDENRELLARIKRIEERLGL